MARTKKEIVEETVQKVQVEETAKIVETTADEPVKVKPLKRKNPTIIAKTPTPLRKRISLQSCHIVGEMKVGTAYEILADIKSTIDGNFYLLKGGYYITQDGNYTINY